MKLSDLKVGTTYAYRSYKHAPARRAKVETLTFHRRSRDYKSFNPAPDVKSYRAGASYGERETGLLVLLASYRDGEPWEQAIINPRMIESTWEEYEKQEAINQAARDKMTALRKAEREERQKLIDQIRDLAGAKAYSIAADSSGDFAKISLIDLLDILQQTR